MTTQYADEGRTKLAVENGVNERIESGVAVAEPEDVYTTTTTTVAANRARR